MEMEKNAFYQKLIIYLLPNTPVMVQNYKSRFVWAADEATQNGESETGDYKLLLREYCTHCISG